MLTMLDAPPSSIASLAGDATDNQDQNHHKDQQGQSSQTNENWLILSDGANKTEGTESGFLKGRLREIEERSGVHHVSLLLSVV